MVKFTEENFCAVSLKFNFDFLFLGEKISWKYDLKFVCLNNINNTEFDDVEPLGITIVKALNVRKHIAAQSKKKQSCRDVL